MDDIKRAMLGDREAQDRVTARGELLPCPFCNEIPTTRVRVKSECFEVSIVCFKCGISKMAQVGNFDTEFDEVKQGMDVAVKRWNTRAPILSAEELERLEENHD